MRVKLYRGTYCAVWTDQAGRTRRASLRTKDRGLADQALAELIRQDAAPAETVGQIAAAYLAERRQTAIAWQRLEEAWRPLAPHFAALRAGQVDRPACRRYVAARRRAGRAPSTIAKELGTLRAALNWHDPKGPAVVELPPVPRRTRRHLDRAEFERLLAACRAAHLRLFVTLALATGARKTALCQLTWDRVDFARGVVVLSDGRHSAKGRATVPMTARARSALSEALAAARTAYVIEWADHPVADVKKAFGRAAARAGLSGVTPHTLRHTAAVWMAERGVPMAEIAQYLGHGDDRVTQRVYARYSPAYLRRAAAALEWAEDG